MSNELEIRVARLEEQMNKLNDGLFGTPGQAGTFELVRRTNETVEKMSETVDALHQDKLKLKGAFAMAGILGGVIGWVANLFTGK